MLPLISTFFHWIPFSRNSSEHQWGDLVCVQTNLYCFHADMINFVRCPYTFTWVTTMNTFYITVCPFGYVPKGCWQQAVLQNVVGNKCCQRRCSHLGHLWFLYIHIRLDTFAHLSFFNLMLDTNQTLFHQISWVVSQWTLSVISCANFYHPLMLDTNQTLFHHFSCMVFQWTWSVISCANYYHVI